MSHSQAGALDDFTVVYFAIQMLYKCFSCVLIVVILSEQNEVKQMRRNFAQILKDAKIDIKLEYQKLYGLLYDRSIQVSNTNRISVYDELSERFIEFYFRGTCLSIDEFNDVYEFHFEKDPADFDIDYLIGFCEYIYNMLMAYQMKQSPFGYGYSSMVPTPINVQFFLSHINQVIDKIGYMQANENCTVIFVEKSPAAIAVAESEMIPENLSYKLISYHHYQMKGNLEEKKSVLLQLASILEAKRAELKKADKVLETDLFYIFNNLNIRHNNINPELKGNYKLYIAQMSNDELERWYDETYQMCLLAFLQIEHFSRKIEFDKLKTEIEK